MKKNEVSKSEEVSVWSAVKTGDAKAVSGFLADGVDVNSRDGLGVSLLSWASMSGHEEVVKMLIERGVDVNVRDKEDRIALHGAAFFGRVDCVKLLVEAGSDLTAMGAANDTPLSVAKSSDQGALKWIAASLKLDVDPAEVLENRKEVVELLVSAGAALSQKDNGKNKRYVLLGRVEEVSLHARVSSSLVFELLNLADGFVRHRHRFDQTHAA